MTAPEPVPDSPRDPVPDALGTPEGDNEVEPDQPLQPAAGVENEDLETPRGSKPDPYKRDHP